MEYREVNISDDGILTWTNLSAMLQLQFSDTLLGQFTHVILELMTIRGCDAGRGV